MDEQTLITRLVYILVTAQRGNYRDLGVILNEEAFKENRRDAVVQALAVLKDSENASDRITQLKEMAAHAPEERLEGKALTDWYNENKDDLVHNLKEMLEQIKQEGNERLRSERVISNTGRDLFRDASDPAVRGVRRIFRGVYTQSPPEDTAQSIVEEGQKLPADRGDANSQRDGKKLS